MTLKNISKLQPYNLISTTISLEHVKYLDAVGSPISKAYYSPSHIPQYNDLVNFFLINYGGQKGKKLGYFMMPIERRHVP